MTEDENICDQCGKTFKFRRNLMTHENKHNGSLPFSCCGFGFPSRRRLQRHRCTVHGDVKNYICNNCGKEFAVKDDLTAHQIRETTVKTLSCDICGHKTVSTAEMREHLESHKEEKTHKCNECGAAYKHRSSLYRHIGQKHK